MVKSWIHSSVATLEAHKSESGVETKCYEYKRNTIEVLLEWILTTRTAATTPRISIFTLSLLKIRPVFLMFPNVCLLISQRRRKISTNGFHHCELHPWESLSLECEQNRTKLRYWKIVANENALPKLPNWVQLKIHSERTTHQKRLVVVLNGRYLNGIMSLKNGLIIFSYFRELSNKSPKNAQKSLKSSKIAVFRLLVNE